MPLVTIPPRKTGQPKPVGRVATRHGSLPAVPEAPAEKRSTGRADGGRAGRIGLPAADSLAVPADRRGDPPRDTGLPQRTLAVETPRADV